jgi:alanyl-tRNA synthetase
VTQKLHLSDTYLTRFEAVVVAVREHEGRKGIVLDRTAFHAEGGGQPADRGTVGDALVEDVLEVGGEVLHLLGSGPAPAPGARVSCAVDWARRQDHLQQHHGQHLLSAAFDRIHGAATLSFHLGAATCTIDLDATPARMTAEALGAAEAEANRLVWADLPVDARERSPEEAAALPLRKDAVKGLRIVVVGGGESGPVVDASPCGGTHPRRTGEVGVVSVLRAQKWGAGTRVEFACGGRVLGLLHQAEDRLARSSAALRCAPAELVAAVEKLAEEGSARRKELDRMLGALAAVEAVRLEGTATSPEPVVARFDGSLGSPAGLKAVAQALAARGRTALLGGVEGGRAHLCFARARGSGAHLGEVLRESAGLVGGKGGGAPDLAQGSGPDVGRLDEALAAAAGRAGKGTGG